MWPAKVRRQFDIAQKDGNNVLENVLHAPYNKLLNTLFPVDTDFTVIPNFQQVYSSKGFDYIVTFEIFLENRPVFVLELERERDFSLKSKRTSADDQLRVRLGDLCCAFGTKLCFYTIEKDTGLVTPSRNPTSHNFVTDAAPVERWNYDILTAEGEAEFRRIVEWITNNCAELLV
ncbi:hypothetical protein D9756_002750 [Leucocoprinus leucothites]|uniref:Uncharacterized protein n=1 Tax=Leucocoprinus leucothites TaxID=201217 RepID=A0A8H5GCG4_9AGAR|nr:hypothetical protein D9756_002750 [Leucoagaricus leucothites]